MDLWKELHTRALSKNNGENDYAYILSFGNRIPRYTTGCKCKEFWNNWIKMNPPKFGKNGEYFEWTVKTHNAVNTKLGKRTYTVPEAKKFYETK